MFMWLEYIQEALRLLERMTIALEQIAKNTKNN